VPSFVFTEIDNILLLETIGGTALYIRRGRTINHAAFFQLLKISYQFADFRIRGISMKTSIVYPSLVRSFVAVAFLQLGCEDLNTAPDSADSSETSTDEASDDDSDSSKEDGQSSSPSPASEVYNIELTGILANAVPGQTYLIEVLRLHSDNSKVQNLASTTSDDSGNFSISVDAVRLDDILLVVVFSDSVSYGQILVPVKNYVNNPEKNDNIEIDLGEGLNATTTIATWIFIRKDVDLDDATPDKMNKFHELIEQTIENLGITIDGKTTAQIAEVMIADAGFEEGFVEIFGETIGDSCRVIDSPISKTFGTLPELSNISSSQIPDAENFYNISPASITGDDLIFKGGKIQNPFDSVTFTFEKVDDQLNALECLNDNVLAPCPVSTTISATTDWQFTVPESVLDNGSKYRVTFEASGSTCGFWFVTKVFLLRWN